MTFSRTSLSIIAVGAVVAGALGFGTGVATGQSVPVGNPPASITNPVEPTNPPSGNPAASPIEPASPPTAPSNPVAADNSGGAGAGGARPSLLPSAGAGGENTETRNALLALTLAGVAIAGAGVATRRIGERS